MRSTLVAIAVTMVVAATNATFAAARHHHPPPTFASAKQNQPTASNNQPKPSYDSCEALSVERGAAPGRGNSANPDALYRAFMQQCLAGQIPGAK
jgi:hypothetical protein